MKDRCLNCPDYSYVTEKNRKSICHCDLEDAIDEFKEALRKTWLYKSMIKFLDWLSERLEK